MVTKKTEVEDAVEAPLEDVMTVDVEVEKEDDGKIRKKQIYEQVTVATGLRKREVRESVDATLAYFHQMLSEGHDLQIPPLGKIRCIGRGEGENAKMIYKLQLQKPKDDKKDEADAQEGLADDDNAD